MTVNIVILGGTGYIGRAVTRKLLEQASDVEVFTVSRTGKNELRDDRITDLIADCTDAKAILAVIPQDCFAIIDLVGGMGGAAMNVKPAEATVAVVQELDIPRIGYVQGSLGSKEFVQSKERAADILRATGRKVTIVNPTLVYGEGRDDALAKMVPLMKFLGLFSKRFKPVTVDAVAAELVSGILAS